MTPNFDARQNFDLDDWAQGNAPGTQHRQSDDEDASSVSAGRQRYCVDCGQPLADGAKFCPSCGREQ